MKSASKLLMVDKDENYLTLFLAEHPRYGNSADLPGGTVDEGESALDGMIREVSEEIGVSLKSADAIEIYSGSQYSRHNTNYTLYSMRVVERPDVILSWEHSSYKWLTRDEFLAHAKASLDTYMHMVASVVDNDD